MQLLRGDTVLNHFTFKWYGTGVYSLAAVHCISLYYVLQTYIWYSALVLEMSTTTSSGFFGPPVGILIGYIFLGTGLKQVGANGWLLRTYWSSQMLPWATCDRNQGGMCGSSSRAGFRLIRSTKPRLAPSADVRTGQAVPEEEHTQSKRSCAVMIQNLSMAFVSTHCFILHSCIFAQNKTTIKVFNHAMI